MLSIFLLFLTLSSMAGRDKGKEQGAEPTQGIYVPTTAGKTGERSLLSFIYFFPGCGQLKWLLCSLFIRSYSKRRVTVSPDTGMIPHKEECIPVSSRCCYHVADQEKRNTRQLLMVLVVVWMRLMMDKEEKVGRRKEEYLYRIVDLSRITRALFTAPSNAEPPRNSNRGWRARLNTMVRLGM